METELLQTPSGQFWCFKNDKIANQIKNLKGTFWGLDQLIFPQDVIFDIGGNLGTFSVFAGQLLKGQGHIFTFEPSPEIRELLEKNIRLNLLSDQVTIQSDVVSDQCCSHSMKLNVKNTGETRFQETSSSEGESFISITLNSWLKEHPEVNQCDFVKIDVEGMELKVLRGATDLISGYQPILYIEVCKYHYLKYGFTVEELEEFLKGFGYHFFRFFNPFPFRDSVCRRLFSLTQGSEFYNLVAIHPNHPRYPKQFSTVYQAILFMLGEKLEILWLKLRQTLRLRSRFKTLFSRVRTY